MVWKSAVISAAALVALGGGLLLLLPPRSMLRPLCLQPPSSSSSSSSSVVRHGSACASAELRRLEAEGLPLLPSTHVVVERAWWGSDCSALMAAAATRALRLMAHYCPQWTAARLAAWALALQVWLWCLCAYLSTTPSTTTLMVVVVVVVNQLLYHLII